MTEKELLTKKFIMVKGSSVDISTEEKPIIGTQGLGPCISFILHNKENKKAIVGHISCNNLLSDKEINSLGTDIINILLDNKLFYSSFDLYLIEGANKSIYNKVNKNSLKILNNFNKNEATLLEILEETLKAIKVMNIESINRNNLSNNDFEIVDSDGNFCNDERFIISKRFAFDSSTGKFVTDKVYFGIKYKQINQNCNHI